MTDYDRIITAIKADIEKQKEMAVNPSSRIFIGGEMRAIEIIEEMKEEDTDQKSLEEWTAGEEKRWESEGE